MKTLIYSTKDKTFSIKDEPYYIVEEVNPIGGSLMIKRETLANEWVAKSHGRVTYTIIAGPFKTKNDAEKVKAKMKRKAEKDWKDSQKGRNTIGNHK